MRAGATLIGASIEHLVGGVFVVLVTPCDHRDPMGLVGEASPVKWGRLHSFVNL